MRSLELTHTHIRFPIEAIDRGRVDEPVITWGEHGKIHFQSNTEFPHTASGLFTVPASIAYARTASIHKGFNQVRF